MRYNPQTDPEPLDLHTHEIHDDMDDMTGDGFDGIVALNGVVKGIVGDLTTDDIEAIEDYLNISLVEAEQS